MKKKDAKIQALRVIYTCMVDSMTRGIYDYQGIGFSMDDAIKIENSIHEILSQMRSKYENQTGLDIHEIPKMNVLK